MKLELEVTGQRWKDCNESSSSDSSSSSSNPSSSSSGGVTCIPAMSLRNAKFIYSVQRRTIWQISTDISVKIPLLSLR